MFLKAAFKLRNIVVLAAALFLAAIAPSMAPEIPWLPYLLASAGAAAYTGLVIRMAKSGSFKEEYRLAERLDGIYDLSRESSALYRRISGRLSKKQRIKAIKVLKQKEELMNHFSRYEDDPVRQKITEQALKLVMAYFNLACSYCDRMRDLSQQNFDELSSRINVNNRKLGSLKNYQAVIELTKTVEMDEKLLKNLQDEREHLEMVNVRLDQIESAIVAFKHRILSNDLTDPEAEEIENTINEATALDNVLSERKRFRQRV